MNWPKPPRLLTSRVRPLPWHCGHVSRPVPARAPLPWHSLHTTSVLSSTSRVTPNTASRRSSSTLTSTSSPRGTGAAPPDAGPLQPAASRNTESNPPPKNMLNRSLKPTWSKSVCGRPLRPSKPQRS